MPALRTRRGKTYSGGTSSSTSGPVQFPSNPSMPAQRLRLPQMQVARKASAACLENSFSRHGFHGVTGASTSIGRNSTPFITLSYCGSNISPMVASSYSATTQPPSLLSISAPPANPSRPSYKPSSLSLLCLISISSPGGYQRMRTLSLMLYHDMILNV